MHSILHEFAIRSSAESVFQAFTVPAQFECWWPKRCTGTPALGERYNFYFGDAFDWFAHISEIAQRRSVCYKLDESDSDWQPTSFGIELTEEDTGTTIVSFYHRDWREANRHFRIASFCWAMLLNGLKNYVEKGIVVSFENRS